MKIRLNVGELAVQSFEVRPRTADAIRPSALEPSQPEISCQCDTNDQSQCDSCYFVGC